MKKNLVLLIVALSMFFGPLAVSAALITFETVDIGIPIQDQFSSDNIIFSNSTDSDGNAPGSVESGGYLSGQSMRASYLSDGNYSMYILFDTPVSYLEAYIYEVASDGPPPSEEPVVEQPEGENCVGEGCVEQPVEETVEQPCLNGCEEYPEVPPEEVVETVYFEFFGSGELPVGNHFSNIGHWEHWIYDLGYPITAINFYSSNEFYLDNLSTEPQPMSQPVPEPATMLLFGTGLAGLAGARLKRKKK